MNRFFNYLLRFFIACHLFIAVQILFLTAYHIFYLENEFAMNLGFFMGLLAAPAAVLLCQMVNWKHFGIVLLVGSVLLKLAVVFILQPPVESDFAVMLDASRMLLSGDTGFSQSPYFSLWAYQSVFVAWQAMLLKICNHIFFIKLVNIALSTASALLLYRLLRAHISKKSAQAALLIMTVFPFMLTMHTLLSNQIPAAFFLVLGIYLVLSRDADRLGLVKYILAGLCIQMGNLLRPEGLIILVAFLAFMLFCALAKQIPVKKALVGTALLLVSYAALSWAAGFAVQQTGLNPNGIKNGNPSWKFVTGLNHDTLGGYSEADWKQIWTTLDENYATTAQTEALQKSMIDERLRVPPQKLAELLLEKVRMQWSVDGLFWSMKAVQERHTLRFGWLQGADRGLFCAALLLSACGLQPMWSRKKRLSATRLLPYFVVFAAFCAFLLVEVQPRYAYLPHLFIFTSAGFGIQHLLRREKERS